jgi:hypothetical protein
MKSSTGYQRPQAPLFAAASMGLKASTMHTDTADATAGFRVALTQELM